MSLSTYYLEDGRHLVQLPCCRHHHRRRHAYTPTIITAGHDNHEKNNSWVSFSFLYGYGAPLGGPLGHRSSRCYYHFSWVTKLSINKWIQLQWKPVGFKIEVCVGKCSLSQPPPPLASSTLYSRSNLCMARMQKSSLYSNACYTGYKVDVLRLLYSLHKILIFFEANTVLCFRFQLK